MKLVVKGLIAGAISAVLMGIFALGVVIYISFDLPEINSLSDYSPPIPSRIYSKDGHLLMELRKEIRDIAKIEEIPDNVINAFLAAEDDNFYNHSGVDYVGIIRATFKNIMAGRIVQGASTITQQVAKSLLLTSERTFTRKIKDLILAKKIEEKLTKKEILFLYLNQVYLGGGYWGVKAAFRGYFDKELSEATVAEVALVAGLLVAPSKYSPYNNPKRAKTRQRYVLGRLHKTGKITKEEYEQALNEDIKIQIRQANKVKAEYFTAWIREQLYARFGEDEFKTNGYEVITTINWELQKKAEEEVLAGVKEIDKRQGYKGPLKSIENPEEQLDFLRKQRDEIYSKASNYLIFQTDGATQKEFYSLETEFDDLLQRERNILTEAKFRNKNYFVVGNLEENRITEFLQLDKPVKAIVEKVSNSQRMIYANYAGLKLMIPYEGFKWAHERKIEIERNYWGWVTHPESIVKKGDVILVKIEDKQESPLRYLHSDFKTKFKANKDLMKAISEQKMYLAGLDQEADAQGALLSIAADTGEIIAMVGGSDFKKSQFNRAVQSNRQPGSAFKPLIFAVGLENQFTASSTLLDSPQALGGFDETSLSWKPRNYDGKFKGSMTFRRALETSRNIPTIKLTQDVGVNKIVNFVERLNLDVELPKDLSVSLGSFGINLLDLVKMYSIFPNGGRILKLKAIESIKDRYGNLYYLEEKEQDPGSEQVDPQLVTENEAEGKKEEKVVDENIEVEEENQNPFLVNLNEEQVYDERLAYLMNNLLRGVVQNGTGRGARRISQNIGGKTGTTNNYVDAWFLGFSPKVVTGVWTGFDNNQTLGFGETGAKSALPIWKSFMELALKKFGDVDFNVPEGIVNVAIDSKSGELYQEGPNRFIEAFVEGTEPGSEPSKSIASDDDGDNNSIIDGDDYYSDQ